MRPPLACEAALVGPHQLPAYDPARDRGRATRATLARLIAARRPDLVAYASLAARVDADLALCAAAREPEAEGVAA